MTNSESHFSPQDPATWNWAEGNILDGSATERVATQERRETPRLGADTPRLVGAARGQGTSTGPLTEFDRWAEQMTRRNSHNPGMLDTALSAIIVRFTLGRPKATPQEQQELLTLARVIEQAFWAGAGAERARCDDYLRHETEGEFRTLPPHWMSSQTRV